MRARVVDEKHERSESALGIGENGARAAEMQLDASVIEEAIRRVAGPEAELVSTQPLAEDRGGKELKQAGYGAPLLVRYRAEGEERRAVFRLMTANWFGHDRRSDRAALALLCADTYALMPKHVRVLDVGAVHEHGDLVSLAGTGEFYLLTTYAAGALYARDLREIEARGAATLLDAARAHALCNYLTELHRDPLAAPKERYTRAIRDLIGSGEGIFGIVDSYPPDGPVSPKRLAAFEQRCAAFRPRLREKAHRLRRTHGDFHPYNVLFREGVDFTLLDASRGGLGEPADDVAAMTINYLFGGVIAPGAWEHGMMPLWNDFWTTYLSATGDFELLEVIAPFLAWRALVLASPTWYPAITPEARDRLLSFAEAALDAPSFDPASASRFVR